MFGKSIFQSVLERLETENATDDGIGDTVGHPPIRGLNAGFAVDTAPAAGSGAVRQAYADMDHAKPWRESPGPLPEPPASSAAPDPEPRHLERQAAADVAEDLGLCASETLASLTEKRRLFASANHPDRHAERHRAAATARMTLANMMIDEAMRRLKRGLPPAPAAGKT